MSLSKIKDSKFITSLAIIEAVALGPFISKCIEGRAVVFWSHAGVKACFVGAIGLLLVGLALALFLKKTKLSLAAAIVFSIPMFIVPLTEQTIILSMPGM